MVFEVVIFRLRNLHLQIIGIGGGNIFRFRNLYLQMNDTGGLNFHPG